MPKLFTVGQVARRLHLSEDKVRSLADEGAIPFQRTPGGHRRFTEVAVARYESREGSPRRKQPMPSARRPSVRRASATAYPAPIDDDEDLLDGFDDDADFPQQVAPPRPVVTPPTWQPAIQAMPVRDRSQEEAEERRRKVAAEATRLQDLKAYGSTSIPYDVPVTVRAQIVEDLETYVTSERVPVWVSTWEQQKLVKGRVEAIAEAYRKRVQEEAQRTRAEQARKVAAAKASQAAQEVSARAKMEAEHRVQALIAHGKRYSDDGIREFDPSDRWEVRSAVEKALREEVASDWDERDVEGLVEEVLDEETDDEED